MIDVQKAVERFKGGRANDYEALGYMGGHISQSDKNYDIIVIEALEKQIPK